MIYPYDFAIRGRSGAVGLWQVIEGRDHPRFGQPCRILARGRNGNILVEFEDGHKIVTVRYGARRPRVRRQQLEMF